MKVLQTNLSRAHGAHDVAYLTAGKEPEDLIEPNKKKVDNAGWTIYVDKDIALFIRSWK